MLKQGWRARRDDAARAGSAAWLLWLRPGGAPTHVREALHDRCCDRALGRRGSRLRPHSLRWVWHAMIQCEVQGRHQCRMRTAADVAKPGGPLPGPSKLGQAACQPCSTPIHPASQACVQHCGSSVHALAERGSPGRGRAGAATGPSPATTTAALTSSHKATRSRAGLGRAALLLQLGSHARWLHAHTAKWKDSHTSAPVSVCRDVRAAA